MVRIYSGPDATHQASVLLVNSWQDRAGSSLPPGSCCKYRNRKGSHLDCPFVLYRKREYGN